MTSEAFSYNDAVSGQSFEDVPVGSTFYPYIERLAVRGLINGYPCGGAGEPCGPNNLPYFRPGNPVTRGQTAKILYLARSLVTPTPTVTATSTVTTTPIATDTDTPVPTMTPTSTTTVVPTDTSTPTATTGPN